MHPALVHYGCAYKAQERSLRAHYYFDNNPIMVSNLKGRETYLFQEVVQPKPLNQCLAAREKKEFWEQILRWRQPDKIQLPQIKEKRSALLSERGRKKRTLKRKLQWFLVVRMILLWISFICNAIGKFKSNKFESSRYFLLLKNNIFKKICYDVYNLKRPEEIEDLFIINTALIIVLATKYFSILINKGILIQIMSAAICFWVER